VTTVIRPADAVEDIETTTVIPPPGKKPPSAGESEATTLLPGGDGSDKSGTGLSPADPGPGPGEKTQVIARGPGETTQDIRPTEGIYPPPGETTKSIEPDERTQAIKLPPVGLDPEPESSIVEAERPDPGADPTTRISAVPQPETGAEPETSAEAETGAKPETGAEAGETGAERPMTVMGMERPPDEADEGRSVPLPAQRRPAED
jgi:hypothetical protein